MEYGHIGFRHRFGHFVDRVKRPLLVVQGEKDSRVKKDQSDRMVDSNSWALGCQVSAAGGIPQKLGLVPDDRARIASAATGSLSPASTRQPLRSSSRASRPAPAPRSTANLGPARSAATSSAANRAIASVTVCHAGRSTVMA